MVAFSFSRRPSEEDLKLTNDVFTDVRAWNLNVGYNIGKLARLQSDAGLSSDQISSLWDALESCQAQLVKAYGKVGIAAEDGNVGLCKVGLRKALVALIEFTDSLKSLKQEGYSLSISSDCRNILDGWCSSILETFAWLPRVEGEGVHPRGDV